jgi:muramoyltetrapeptide carboxypeptidase
VLTTIIGSDYLPGWKGSILFVEDVRERIYRVDRMFTQLKLAGVLDEIAGFILGRCTECLPGEGYGSLTLDEVIEDHIEPLGIPAWQGAMIGHIEDQYTIPIGVEVESDADKGVIRMLEPAVR